MTFWLFPLVNSVLSVRAPFERVGIMDPVELHLYLGEILKASVGRCS